MANYASSAFKLSDTYVNTLPYNTCSTAAGTATKTVSAGTFSLETGAMVVVKFTVTNTAANPTLNVSSTGAKAIYYNGAAITAGYLKANKIYQFIYNGAQWDLVGDVDTNTTYTSLKKPNALTVKGNGTQSFTYDGSAAKTLNIKAGTNVSVSSDTSGNITISATDTKVTSVENHYTPAANSASELSADASSTTSATWGSTDLVTGVNIQRDAAGHVTGVTVDSIQMPANPNTHAVSSVNNKTGAVTLAATDISGFATVATSGSYNDLKDQPTIPTVNNGTLTIQKNGTTVKTFTANSSSNVIANIAVPTKVSELTNDSGFTTASGHTHDGSYYKKSEIDTKLTNKLDAYIFTGTYTENGDSTYSVTLNDSYSWDDMAAAINANRYVSCMLLDEDGVHPLYFTLGGIYIDDSYVTFNSIDECYQVWELYIDRGGQFGLGTEHLAVQSNLSSIDLITVEDIDEICGASITMITEDGEVEF